MEPDFIELCGVTAHIYDPQAQIYFDRFFEHFGNHVWWFADPTVQTVRDVIERIEVQADYSTGQFKSLAVRFELHPMFNPYYIQQHPCNVISAMDVEISSGQQFGQMLFDNDESESIRRMAEIAIAQADDDLREAYFVGVFGVHYDEYRDNDGHLDEVQVLAEFLRVFEFEKLSEAD